MGKVLARGHSRVPVYSGNPRNIIGLLLVCVFSTFDFIFSHFIIFRFFVLIISI